MVEEPDRNSALHAACIRRTRIRCAPQRLEQGNVSIRDPMSLL
jgi:hypothetical protein